MSRSKNLLSALAALLLVAPALHAVDVTTSGDTKLRVYGFVHVYANYFANGDQQVLGGSSRLASSMFYAGYGSNFADFSAAPTKTIRMNYAPTRLGFATTTPSADLGDITTKLEYDHNGTNYGHIRLAQIGIGNWTLGQQWSVWSDGDAGADTVDWAGPIGSSCYDTPRFVAINYSVKLDKNNSLAFALEENSGLNDGNVGDSATAKGKMPTIVGAYTYSADWGHIGLRALAQNYSVYVPATATTSSTDFSKMAGAVMLSGNVAVGKDNVVYSVYTGSGLGQYGTGLQDISVDATNKEINLIKSTGWVAGYTHVWTDAVRSNLVLSGVSFSSDDKITGTNSTNGVLAKTMMYATVNTFVKVAKNAELGFEYVYENAKAFGSNVWTDEDAKLGNKQTGNKVEVSLHVGF
jgi:hypothetical protein